MRISFIPCINKYSRNMQKNCYQRQRISKDLYLLSTMLFAINIIDIVVVYFVPSIEVAPNGHLNTSNKVIR